MDFRAARERMVAQHIAARGVRDARVLSAMRRIPREAFVPADQRERAYDDAPLPIGRGQTISQPYIVARMCELARLRGGERVLEVGLGCGYEAAVLASLAREVYAVDVVAELATRAEETLADLDIANVHTDCFDASGGWPAHAPYDAIVVAAGAPRIPALLLDQLTDGGRCVVPVGPRDEQVLTVIVRHGDAYDVRRDTPVRFVDLVGRFGWSGGGPPQA